MKSLRSYFNLQRCASVGYQLAFLIITTIILALLTYKPITEFHAVGKSPIIKQWDKELEEVSPKKPVHVHVGLHIADFLKFDTVKNEFIINAFVWFSYDSKAVSADVIDAFYFTKGDIVHKSTPIVKTNNGITTALYTIRVQFSTILDYERFPLDDHRIYLNLTNQLRSADELIYDANQDDYIISPNIYISGWKAVGKSVNSGYADLPLGTSTVYAQPKTVFALDLSKSDMRQLSLIILPLLFLFYLGLFSFCIKDLAVAMTLPLASASGLFAYSFVIQTLAPMVGYMMLSDYLFLFFLLSNFIIFFVKALAAIPEHILSRNNYLRIEGGTVLLLHIALIIVWYILMDVRGI